VNLTTAARWAFWLSRHPRRLRAVACGENPRDLLLREELSEFGVHRSPVDVRGLARSHVSAKLVSRLLRHLRDLRPRALIDIGASTGSFSVAAHLAYPGIRIVAFEPLPPSFVVLRETLSRIPEASALPMAVGDSDSTTLLHQSGNPGSSSLRPMLPAHVEAFPGTTVQETVRVRVAPLDALNLQDLPRPVLMKIDVQGFEDRVLKGARKTLGTVNAVIVEMSRVPLYEGQSLEPAVTATLLGAGFRREEDFDEIRDKDGRVLQVDGYFLRGQHGHRVGGPAPGP
jgi:FkbM family methyltransferase